MGILPIASLLWLTSASAYSIKLNEAGDELRWAEMDLGFYVNPANNQGFSESEVVEAARAAASQWSAVEGSHLRVNYLGQTDVDQVDYADSKNLVYFEQDWPEEWDDSYLALTFTWSVEGGTLIAFDLAINEDLYDWSNSGGPRSNDLRNTITHEIGHAVGIGHSEIDDATMFFQSSPGDTDKRDLALDDQEATRYLYGTLLAQQFACSTGGSASAGALALIFSSVFVFRRRQGVR
jgi:hypothetical protein